MTALVIAALALGAIGCVIGSITWIRHRRTARTLAAYVRVLELANTPEPPPDGDGQRRPHLRIVAAFMPLLVFAGWLASVWRRHPMPVSLAAMTTGLAAIVGIGVLAHGPGGTPTAQPPPPVVSPTGPTTISATPTVHRRRRPPVLTGSRTTPGLPPDGRPDSTPPIAPTTLMSRPASRPAPSTTGPAPTKRPPRPTTTRPAASTTPPAPACQVVCLSIAVHLPAVDDMPDAPSLRDLLGVN